MPEDVVYHDRLPDLAAAVNNGIVYSDKVILEYRQQQTDVTTNEKMTFFRKLRNFLNVTGTMASYRYSVTLCEELLKKRNAAVRPQSDQGKHRVLRVQTFRKKQTESIPLFQQVLQRFCI